jgi:ferredoxin
VLPKDVRRKKAKYRNKLPKNDFELYKSWCIKCELCCKVCPEQVLFVGDEGYPELLKPEECTKCFICTKICPGFAITFIDEKNKSLYRAGKFLEGRF